LSTALVAKKAYSRSRFMVQKRIFISHIRKGDPARKPIEAVAKALKDYRRDEDWAIAQALAAVGRRQRRRDRPPQRPRRLGHQRRVLAQ
jgi:hypothetical protein